MDNNLIELIQEELKKSNRRMDSIQKTLDLLFNDRNMLEDIVSRLAQVENALNLNKTHQTEMQQDIKMNIAQAQFSTEDKVEQIQKTMDEKIVIVKAEKENLVEKILNKFKEMKK